MAAAVARQEVLRLHRASRRHGCGEGSRRRPEKEDETEETLNRRKAIWLRNRSEVKPEEYEEFYKQLATTRKPPAATSSTMPPRGRPSSRCLLSSRRTEAVRASTGRNRRAGLKLYVQRVLIMERCEQVLPFYLRFVKGVVDSADLPLNVSRELLQQNPLLDVIQKSVVKNVLDTLAGMKNVEFEKYLAFYKGFGPVLKEGLTRDWIEPREDRRPAALRDREHGTRQVHDAGRVRGEDAAAIRQEIHYLIGETTEQLRHSPYLEAFRAKGQDVLLLTDPIDEFAIPQLGEYKGKQLQAADRGETSATGAKSPPA